MNLFEDTNPRSLKELLAEINNRTTALPDFQRDFVWDPSATQELIVSIANNYPAGSILRVRDAKRVFAAREFEGAPSLVGTSHVFLILDGQQRLTSLYQAFYGVGDHRYFLNLRKLIDGADFEDAIFHVRANSSACKKFEDLDYQSEELCLPLSVLKGGSGSFTQWARKVARQLPDKDRIALEDALDEVAHQWIQTIDDYQFPVVTLSDKTEPDALCTIFETLNRTGVKLSVFELLTARFWPQHINLRALWDEAITTHRIIADFDVDPYYVLQAIALASRKSPSCKRKDVLNLQAQDIEVWWHRVVVGLAEGLSILRDDCKVMQPRWLPYQTMVIPLAAVLAKTRQSNSPIVGAQRAKINRWFWCAVFGQYYETSPNSQSAKDVTELTDWLLGGKPPESVDVMNFNPQILYDTTPRQRGIYRGVICLILASGMGTRDFHTQAVITSTLMNEQGIDDHHIFPANFLEKQLGVTLARLRDCILNRTLIDRTTNQIISDRAPADYMTQIQSTPGFPFDAVLHSHLLPVGADAPFWRNDYHAFLVYRQQAIWREIQRVTGVAPATTPIPESNNTP